MTKEVRKKNTKLKVQQQMAKKQGQLMKITKREK